MIYDLSYNGWEERAPFIVRPLYVAEEARLKVQYSIIAEQLKAIKLKKSKIMMRFRDAAASSGECERCRALRAEVQALKRRLDMSQSRNSILRCRVTQSDADAKRYRTVPSDVEPSSDGSVQFIGVDPPCK